jgi:origin recognition complex subunit 6
MLSSGVSSVVYKNTRAMLQKALGVRSSASPRDLCVQFGCAKVELPVRVTLAAFKDKYLQRLPPGDRASANLSNPIFLAAVFYLVARKHKVKIARERLLTTLGLTSGELHRTVAVVAEIVPDLVGVDEKKENAAEKSSKKRKSTVSGSEDKVEGEEETHKEEEAPEKNDHVVDHRDEEEEKKEDRTSPKDAVKKARRQPTTKKAALTEKKLRQAVLAYATNEGPSTKAATTTTRTRASQSAAVSEF